jgi:hypothetical protein
MSFFFLRCVEKERQKEEKKEKIKADRNRETKKQF